MQLSCQYAVRLLLSKMRRMIDLLIVQQGVGERAQHFWAYISKYVFFAVFPVKEFQILKFRSLDERYPIRAISATEHQERLIQDLLRFVSA